MGIKSYQDYRVINLWEVEANLVFQQNLTSLLPFVPILKGGGEEEIVREAVIKLRENEQLSDLEPLLSFFASFVLEIPIVQQIMRWDMAILRESPWYQEILQEGEKSRFTVKTRFW
jgi:predicted transposase YdaD